jgi:DNA-binding transcriptional LysR family regulator
LILDDSGLMLDAALAGMGLGYLAEQTITPLIKDGQLIQMLVDWMPQEAPLCLYYSGRRHVPAKFASVHRPRSAPRPEAVNGVRHSFGKLLPGRAA